MASEVEDYFRIARAMIEIGDREEIAAVFKLRDEATAAMVRQCCLPDEPSDAEVCDWLARIPANREFLRRGLDRTNQRIVTKQQSEVLATREESEA